MRFLRTIRLDDSDTRVFPAAAEAGEWAVPGSFAFTFSDLDPGALKGRDREAFTRGFLGLGSFGWSTVAVISEISEAELRQVLERLAWHFVERYGAPGLEAALEEARREVNFVQELCGEPVNTLLTLERRLGPEGISEDFRVHRPRAQWEGARAIQLVPEQSGVSESGRAGEVES